MGHPWTAVQGGGEGHRGAQGWGCSGDVWPCRGLPVRASNGEDRRGTSWLAMLEAQGSLCAQGPWLPTRDTAGFAQEVTLEVSVWLHLLHLARV